MKNSLDALPLLLFFVAYYFSGFFVATQVFVTTTAIFLGYSYLKSPQPIKAYTSQLLVIGLGGLTLITRNEMFLVWKPTVMYLLTAVSLIVSQLYFQRSLLEKGISSLDLSAPSYPWKRLDFSLALFFTLLAIANLQVFQHFGLDVWIKYKFYSLFVLLLMMAPIMLHIVSHEVKQDPA